MRPRLSLAGQFLAFQLAIVLLVVVVVAGVSVAQAYMSFERDEGRRLRAVAEHVAANSLVRSGVLGKPDYQDAMRGIAEGDRVRAGLSDVLIANARGVLLNGPDVGRRIELGGSHVMAGRSWVGTIDRGGITLLVAHVPVLSEQGRMIGLVAAERAYPTLWEQLAEALPNLVTYLLLGGLLGVVGSLLLARRVKRQTLGLEPREIVGLVEQREAMLHGIREGVLGVDPAGRITLANDEGLRLLGLPGSAVGQELDNLDLGAELVDVLRGRVTGADQIVLRGDRVLVLNRMPIEVRGRPIGAVATLRDRTELVELQRELDTSRSAAETLRAQAHEFTNRLHTIAGLIELGEYDEVARYVHRASQAHQDLTRAVTSRIADPSLAALLVAKASLAAEQGVRFRLAAASKLPPVDEAFAADLVTVVGNLVDNALDAVQPGSDGWVEVEIALRDNVVHAAVRDSGPGVAPDLAEDMFRRGYSTKAADQGHLGLGLALARLVCTRRGGEIAVHNEAGAVFTVRIPVSVPAVEGAQS